MTFKIPYSLIVLLACLQCAHIGWNQNNFGSLHSNYTPTNSVYVNPSSMLDAKTWLDINIVGVGSYVNNDLVYLQDQSWISLLRDLSRVSRGQQSDATLPDEDDIMYRQGRRNYHVYNRNFVTVPSAVWSQGDHAAGLSLGGRSYTAVRKVPEFIGRFIENGVPEYTPQHDIDYSVEKLRVSSLHFGEVKGSYAYTFRKSGRDMFMGGVSVSKFFSVAGGAATIHNLDFNVDNDSLVHLFRLKSDAMYTNNPRLNTKGGMGLDIGFTYQKMYSAATSYYPNSKRMGCRKIPYKYKIGVSIIDIGSVKFDEEDTQYAGYDFENYDWYNYDEPDVDENNPLTLFQNQESDITSGEVRKPTKIRLPTFISAQFDVNLWASRLYLNGTIIQGLPVSKKKFGLRHANSLSITPRYETYWFEASLPISLYEYRYPQLGASFRVWFLTIGTDKLISWIGKTRLYGADIYAALKIPIRYNPKCRSRIKNGAVNNGQNYKEYHPCDAYN